MIIKLNKQEVLDAIVKSFPILQGQEGVNLTFIDDGAEITLGEETTPVQESPQTEEKPAPKKRKRRTKAQIAADEAKAKAEAEEATSEPVQEEVEDSDDSVFGEPKSDRMDMQEPDGLGIEEDEDEDEESIFG